MRFHVALARAEMSLFDRFADETIDLTDQIYAQSRKMELMVEISRICYLTEEMQEQIINEYERINNLYRQKIGQNLHGKSNDAAVFALVSLVMVPYIDKLIR